MEAMMYSLFVGCQNLGQFLASYFGAITLAWLDINPDGSMLDTGRFTKLWEAAMFQAFAPLVILWMLPIVVPHATQIAAIIDEVPGALTRDSPWSRLHFVQSLVQRLPLAVSSITSQLGSSWKTLSLYVPRGDAMHSYGTLVDDHQGS